MSNYLRDVAFLLIAAGLEIGPVLGASLVVYHLTGSDGWGVLAAFLTMFCWIPAWWRLITAMIERWA